MFYLWNIKELKRDLIDHRLTEDTRFRYLFLFLLVVLGIGQFGYQLGLATQGHRFGVLYSLLVIACTAVGAYVCYHANGQNEGVRFLERFVSLFILTAIRSCLPLIAVIAAYLMWADFDAADYRHPRWHSYLLIFLPMSLFFARLAFHLGDVHAAIERRLQHRRNSARARSLELNSTEAVGSRTA
jgi:hypothetical protein